MPAHKLAEPDQQHAHGEHAHEAKDHDDGVEGGLPVAPAAVGRQADGADAGPGRGGVQHGCAAGLARRQRRGHQVGAEGAVVTVDAQRGGGVVGAASAASAGAEGVGEALGAGGGVEGAGGPDAAVAADGGEEEGAVGEAGGGQGVDAQGGVGGGFAVGGGGEAGGEGGVGAGGVGVDHQHQGVGHVRPAEADGAPGKARLDGQGEVDVGRGRGGERDGEGEGLVGRHEGGLAEGGGGGVGRSVLGCYPCERCILR